MPNNNLLPPEELRNLPQWVTWKLESRNGSGKPTKVPYDPKHADKKASVTDPTTWATYGEAVEAAAKHGRDGIGFVFTESDPFVGIDFDDCFDAGEIKREIRAIIEELDSYTEISQSGEGIHIIARAENLPSGKNSGWCEMYSTARYFVTTGRHVEGTPETVECREEAVRALYAKITEPQTPEAPAAEKPKVILPGDETPITESARDAFTVIAGRGMEVFHFAGRVSFLTPEGELEIVTPELFCSLIERYARTVAIRVFNKGEETVRAEVPRRCPTDTAKKFLASEERRLLPPVAIVTNAPVMIEDNGYLETVTSYSPKVGGILVRGGIEPEEMEIGAARDALLEVLKDFDFVSDGDRARALASLVTPALRLGGFMGREPVPIFMEEADQSQSGKTFLGKTRCAIYGEKPEVVPMRTGGVGSFDESLGSALLRGRPFIQIDNVRGKLDSPCVEAMVTAEDSFPVRVPHRGSVNVDPGRYILQLTSNGIEATADLANRSCITRIRKRAEGYKFTRYPAGDILDHIRANAGKFLGAVFTVVERWVMAGKPAETDTPHDFRKWARALDWIVRDLIETPLMQGHEDAKKRVGDPVLGGLRAFCITLKNEERIGEVFVASQIVEVCDDHGIPGLGDGADTEAKARRLGGRLAKLYKDAGGNVLTLDEFSIRREVATVPRDGGGNMERKTYTVEENGQF